MVADHTERPTGRHLSRWRHMSARERAYAYRLLLLQGWEGRRDVTTAASYCTDTDRVCVEWHVGNPRAACAVAALAASDTAETALASIERTFGAAARARAEAAIA